MSSATEQGVVPVSTVLSKTEGSGSSVCVAAETRIAGEWRPVCWYISLCGPTAEVVSRTGDDVTGLRAPVHCQLEAAAQDAADEPSFGSGSLSASLLRGASMRNNGISCCYATME